MRALILLPFLTACARLPSVAPADLPSFRWAGTATVHAAARTIEIGVRTQLLPGGAARSDTWLLSQGPGSTRSLLVGGRFGCILRDGKASAMAEAMWRHEQQQYAIYGLMQQALRHGPRPGSASLTLGGSPAAPLTTFEFEPDGRLRSARNQVPDPEGKARIDQLFLYSGEIRSGALRWPQPIDIYHGTALYFTLRLNSFQASRNAMAEQALIAPCSTSSTTPRPASHARS